MTARDNALGSALLAIAREAIASAIGARVSDGPSIDAAVSERLEAPGATFVTLTMNDRLRGCIGSLVAHRPLGEDVAKNAVAAATADPRFMPLAATELASVSLSVSLLTAPHALDYDGSEAGAVAAMRPGIDGIVLRQGNKRATFLPQVWEELADSAEFLRHLRAKAGIDTVSWPEGITLERYEVRKWADK